MTYSENNEEKIIINIIEDQYELIAPVGSIIKLITMSDQSCEGTVSGAASVKSFENPTLEIVGSGAICGVDAPCDMT